MFVSVRVYAYSTRLRIEDKRYIITLSLVVFTFELSESINSWYVYTTFSRWQKGAKCGRLLYRMRTL